MIEKLNAEFLSAPAEPFGQRPVFLARFRVATRMIVGDDDGGRGVFDGRPEDLPGMNQAAGQGAARDFDDILDLMLGG